MDMARSKIKFYILLTTLNFTLGGYNYDFKTLLYNYWYAFILIDQIQSFIYDGFYLTQYYLNNRKKYDQSNK